MTPARTGDTGAPETAPRPAPAHGGDAGMQLRVEVFPADLDATVAFYVDVLGFVLVRDERATLHPYVSLHRGGALIGAAARPEVVDRTQRRPPTGIELVLEVEDVDAERARVERAGWTVAEDLVDRPWGLRDFRVLDPDGHYLRITSRAQPSQPAFSPPRTGR